jgi:hypothetical protein|tara:strand:+ start:360 stop:695 length:336 start_codon:yes stop_codon:yes gene_type:complete
MKRIAQSALMFEEMIEKFPKVKAEVMNKLLDGLARDMWKKNLLTYRESKVNNEHDVGMGKLGQIEYKLTGFLLSSEEMEKATSSLKVLKSFAPPSLQKDVDELIEVFNVEG